MQTEDRTSERQSHHFYRFRRAEALLDEFRELEQQYFVFSAASDLNDPMEGFSDVFWRGDDVLWSSLIKHYTFCFTAILRTFCIIGNLIDSDALLAFARCSPLPNNCPFQIPEYHKAWPSVLERPGVKKLIASLSLRAYPVRRNELTSYLRLLHPIIAETCLRAFAETFAQDGLKFASFTEEAKEAEGFLVKFTALTEEEELRSEIFFATQQAEARNQLFLLKLRNTSDASAKATRLITSFFPFEYVECLEKIVFPDRFISSFSKSPSNSSMWGSYARSHSGACLIFRAERDNTGLFINANAVVGAGFDGRDRRVVRQDRKFYFKEVRYDALHPEIDFFGSLGQYTVECIEDFWLSSEGRKSSFFAQHWGNEEAFRTSYWANFNASSLCKTPEWTYETEYRLIHSSMVQDLSEIENRKAFYNFQSLDGIIFGMKTSIEDKAKMIDIIRGKCKENGRKEFNFFQMVYIRESRSFEPTLLDISLI